MVESSAALRVQSIHFSSTKILPSNHVAVLWRHPLLSPRLHSIRFLFSLPFLPPFSTKTTASLLLLHLPIPCSEPDQSSPVSSPTVAPSVSTRGPVQHSSGSSNVGSGGGGTGGGCRVHGRDGEGAAGPSRPHCQPSCSAWRTSA